MESSYDESVETEYQFYCTFCGQFLTDCKCRDEELNQKSKRGMESVSAQAQERDYR